MILIAISFWSNEGEMGGGQSPQKIFGSTPFQSKENALFYITRTLQKGHFRKMGMSLDVSDVVMFLIIAE